jgi:hypothetical protein
MSPARPLRSSVPLLAAALLSTLPEAHAERKGKPVPEAIDCARYDLEHGDGACAKMCAEENDLLFGLPTRPGWHLVDITCELRDGAAIRTRYYREYDGGHDEYEPLRVIRNGGGVGIENGGGVLDLRGDAEIFVVVESPDGGLSEGYLPAEGGSIEVSVGDFVWVAFADPLVEGQIEVLMP